MRLRGIFSCAFCASLFSLSAWGYTITSATATVSYWTYPDGGYPVLNTATCSQSDASYSECVMSDPAYGTGGLVAATYQADNGNFEVGATAAWAGYGDKMDAEAYARLVESFAFIPDTGSNAPAGVQFSLDDSWYVSGDVYIRSSFNGQAYNVLPSLIEEPYNGGPVFVDAMVSVGAYADSSYDSAGNAVRAQLHIREIHLIDADGNPVSGRLILLPEPVYGLWIGAVALAVAVSGQRARSRCRG